MDILSEINQVNELLLRHESNYTMMLKSLSNEQQGLVEMKKKHSELMDKISLDLTSSVIIQQIFDKVSDVGFRFLEDLINKGLSAVYPDAHYQCKLDVGIRGNEKTVEFYLNEGDEWVPISECGGGPQTVISLVLRTYYIVKNNLRRVIFLDESFYAISGSQLESFVSFLKSLSTSLGFKFLWVTHNKDVMNLVEDSYEMYSGTLKKIEV